MFLFQKGKKKKEEMSNLRRKGSECFLRLHHEEKRLLLSKGVFIVLVFLRNLKIYPEM